MPRPDDLSALREQSQSARELPLSSHSIRVRPPRAVSLVRGVGISAGVFAFAFVGLVDGIITLVRSRPGLLAYRYYPIVILHCIAVLMSIGIGFGLFTELVLRAGSRIVFLQRFADWCVGGPRRWFARDPGSAHAVFSAFVMLVIVVAPILPASTYFITNFHSHLLMALASALLVPVLMGAAVVAVILIAPFVAMFMRRIGRLASPGTILLLATIGTTAHLIRFSRLNWTWMQHLDWGSVTVGLAMLVGDAGSVIAIGAWRRKKKSPVSLRFLSLLTLVTIAAFFLSAVTFRLRQTVATTIYTRSTLTASLVRVLQRTWDFDRDGYSPLFNGGDCNDHDRRIHPNARDIPGNGIDENCSGHDASTQLEEDDGHLVRVVGPMAAQHPSFIILSVDAVRPDHVGAYGYRRNTTPAIDAFARNAAVFTNAFCTSPRTLRSFASIWTGRYPSFIDWGEDNQYPPLEPSNITLAELLHRAGYVNGAFSNTHYFTATVGFAQGFDSDHETTRGFKEDMWTTVNEATSWLDTQGNGPSPFFMWLHLMEPHDPYADLEEPRDFGHDTIDRYDEEIARADTGIARLLQTIDPIAARRNVIVVLMSDHGEAFGEHGYWTHSNDLHDEETRVMLMIRGPGIAPGRRVSLTSLMDLQPTFLNYAGMHPGTLVSSRSLVPVLQDAHMPFVGGSWRDHLYTEITPDGRMAWEQKSLFAPPYKVLWDVQHGTWELFDIAHDPHELHNLFDDEPALAETMRQRLMTWVESVAIGRNRSEDVIAAARLPAVPRMQNPIHMRFGNVLELLGYDIDSRTVPIGGTIHLTLYYRVLGATTEPLEVGVLFTAEDHQDIWNFQFHAVHQPLAGRYPTTRWVPGEIIRDAVSLHVLPETRPTPMRMLFVVQGPTMVRTPPASNPTANGEYDIGPINITPQ